MHVLYPFINGHFGCFRVLANVNSAAVNNGVPESFQSMVFSRYVLRNGIVGSYGSSIFSFRASLVAQMVKRLPTMWETRVQSLDREDPLDKEMATHSSILAWKIPWMEDPGRLQSMGLQRVRHD